MLRLHEISRAVFRAGTGAPGAGSRERWRQALSKYSRRIPRFLPPHFALIKLKFSSHFEMKLTRLFHMLKFDIGLCAYVPPVGLFAGGFM